MDLKIRYPFLKKIQKIFLYTQQLSFLMDFEKIQSLFSLEIKFTVNIDLEMSFAAIPFIS